MLRLQLSKAEATLSAAGGLLDSLSGERGRWGGQLGGLAAALAALPMDALLAAAGVVHLSARPEEERGAIMAEWAG